MACLILHSLECIYLSSSSWKLNCRVCLVCGVVSVTSVVLVVGVVGLSVFSSLWSCVVCIWVGFAYFMLCSAGESSWSIGSTLGLWLRVFVFQLLTPGTLEL